MAPANNVSARCNSACRATIARATRSRRSAERIALRWLRAASFAVAALFPAAACAQLMEPDPGMEDIARTPLEILNLDAEKIPDVLVAAMADPYAYEALTTCDDIVGEVAMIDQVLGADFDIAEAQSAGLSLGGAAKSVIGSFIPFRGVIREVSGANRRLAEVRLAILAGMVRRSYLKGLGQSRGCTYPARPSDARAERVTAQPAKEPKD